ncbi:MAG: dTMP kinase [Mariprofundaceae bacterium]|nr:dTMP kinase [Mariprofundaceae bacterium]
MNQLITFEGADGCGKSTQLQLTTAWLRHQGKQVLQTKQPGGTPLGVEIRRLLLSGEFTPIPECELLMFLADRAQHVKEVIQPALQAGVWVLCDRYSDSTLAYQLAARGLDEKLDLTAMLAFAEAGCVPHQTFWFDVSIETAMLRLEKRQQSGEPSNRLDDEAMAFHQRVHQAFGYIYQANQERMIRLDASASIETIQQQIQQIIQKKIRC